VYWWICLVYASCKSTGILASGSKLTKSSSRKEGKVSWSRGTTPQLDKRNKFSFICNILYNIMNRVNNNILYISRLLKEWISNVLNTKKYKYLR
jgi:hypothetical protein